MSKSRKKFLATTYHPFSRYLYMYDIGEGFKYIPNNLLAVLQASTESSVEKEEARLQPLDDILRRHGAQTRQRFVETPLLPCVRVLKGT